MVALRAYSDTMAVLKNLAPGFASESTHDQSSLVMPSGQRASAGRWADDPLAAVLKDSAIDLKVQRLFWLCWSFSGIISVNRCIWVDHATIRLLQVSSNSLRHRGQGFALKPSGSAKVHSSSALFSRCSGWQIGGASCCLWVMSVNRLLCHQTLFPRSAEGPP
jgi:hypothetical protein